MIADGGTARDTAPAPPADAGGPTCHDLVASDPPLRAKVVSPPRPATEKETGGPLQDGMYMLTSISFYDVPDFLAPDLAALKLGGVLRLAGGVMDSVTLFEDGTGGAAEDRLREMVTVSGNTITSIVLCPDDLDTEYFYTAEGKNLRFSWLDPDGGVEIVMVYTMR